MNFRCSFRLMKIPVPGSGRIYAADFNFLLWIVIVIILKFRRKAGSTSREFRMIILLSGRSIWPILNLQFDSSIFTIDESEMESKMIRDKAPKKMTGARDIDNCRCSDIGLAGLAECLQAGPCPCSYALPFGYRFLCKHPRVNEIVMNTRKARLAVKI